jgi:hypothetical protein
LASPGRSIRPGKEWPAKTALQPPKSIEMRNYASEGPGGYLTIDKESKIVKLNLDKLHIGESFAFRLIARVLILAA